MRWAETALFLTPFLLYAAWRAAAARASPGLVWAAIALVLALGAVTVWLGVSHRLDAGETYVPARWQGGHIVPGHGAAP